MHAVSTSKSKEPMLPSQDITYAKFGTWRDHFSSTLTPKGLQVFAALDSTIPTEYPEVKEDEDDEDSLELTNVLTLQWKVINKYEFAPSQLRPTRSFMRPRRTTSKSSA